MTTETKLRCKYFMWAIFASLFALFGVQNFLNIVQTPGVDTKVMLSALFLVLDIYLFFVYNSRALDCLKQLKELKEKKPD